MSLKIAAIVVTYNRISLLQRCLEALANQSQRIESIIVIDNHSTDETWDFLKAWKRSGNSILPNNVSIRMEENTGGAGGFNKGIRSAIETDHDWVWLMDDDVVPNETALAELVHAAEITSATKGFYSSLAMDESMQHPVNVPAIDMTPVYQGYASWGRFLAESIVKTSTSTFVSLLISRESIIKVGLPIKEFFIWGDDTEYTRRMAKNGIQGYLVGRSRVVHLRPGPHGINIRSETEKARISRYKFLYRNWTYISRKFGSPSLQKYILKSLMDILSLLLKYRSPVKSFIVMRGLISGICFAPHIETISESAGSCTHKSSL